MASERRRAGALRPVRPIAPESSALMLDIGRKNTTLRVATASAVLHLQPATLAAIRENAVPKGDPLPVAKVAAVMAARNTPQFIPYCHPLQLDGVDVSLTPGEGMISIEVTVRTIHKTGVEMEALTAASAAALTLYDMLKGIDDRMEIGPIRLLSKKGGKDQWKDVFVRPLRAAVLTLSDSVAAGRKADTSGALLAERLAAAGLTVVDRRVIGDDLEDIVAALLDYADVRQLDLVMTTGGTGLGPRDNTPEAMSRVIEREAPGIMEAARAYGQARMPYAMLARGRAGLRGRTLIVNLPGSRNGVAESLDALLPHLLHAFKMMAGGTHPGDPRPAQG